MVQVVGVNESMRKEVTCGNCLSVLRYAPIDVVKTVQKDYSGCTDIYRHIVCPNCTRKVSVGR